MMKEVLAKAIITEFGKELGKSSSGILKDLKDEFKHFFDDGLSKYLEKNRLKYIKVKTLLHRTTPVKFYDIYQKSRITRHGKSIKLDSVKDVFSESNYVTIIGEAGSGKSTLIKHLFLSTIVENYSIPIIIELRYLNDYNLTIEDYIKEKILDNQLSPNNKILNRLLKNGGFVFFLDGFDEIKSSSRSDVIEKLNTFIDKYTSNKFLLTSRPYSNIELLPLFQNYSIAKLSNEEITEFIKKQKIDPEIADKIINSIRNNKIAYIKAYLANPLLLSLYILTFSSNPSIPDKKYIFYRRVFDVLFKEHDSLTKIGYERELKTKFTQDEFEDILKVFSFFTYFDNHYNFDNQYLTNALNLVKKQFLITNFNNQHFIDDLKSAIGLWAEDGGIISFAHRSMQEYFAALYTSTFNENKEIIYNNISSKLSIQDSSESHNFLNLCDELDKYAFRKYMLLPSLVKIQNQISTKTELEKVQSCLELCYSKLDLRKTGDGEKPIIGLYINIENKSNRFAIEEYSEKIAEEFFKMSKNDHFFDFLNKNAGRKLFQGDEESHILSYDCFFSSDKYTSYTKKQVGFIKACLALNTFVKKSIIEVEQFINEKNKTELNLIAILNKNKNN